MDREDLHAYQEEAVRWMEARREGFVWLGLGDGKTIIALTLIADLDQPTLVVGTKNIVEITWPEEIKKWTHTNGLSYAAASGPLKKRIAAVESNPDILGVSYENLRWMYQTYPSMNRPVLILDESSKMKTHSTKRFRSHLRRVGGFERRYGLSATPAAESYVGLWAQTASISTRNLLGRTITEFRNRFTTQSFRGMYTEYLVGESNKREIENTLRPMTFVIDDSDRPAVPEPTVIDHRVDWSDDVAEMQYREMERRLIVELTETPTTISAASMGVAYNKCRQIASGFLYDSDHNAHFLDGGKIDRIEEEYEALGGDPVLIFYQFEWERDVLMERLSGAETLEPGVFERWNQGDVKCLVLHPASCGHGLNLMGPCRHLFWASLPWSLEHYLQANGRIHRQGQTRNPIIKRFLRAGTIEDDVADRLAGKMDGMMDLLDRIKART